MALALFFVWGCSGDSLRMPLRKEMAVADRYRDWAMVYYHSWRREKNPYYLNLARQKMSEAITTYYGLQVRMGHSYPDFYRVDAKRRNSCILLHELIRTSMRFRVEVESQDQEGCLVPR